MIFINQSNRKQIQKTFLFDDLNKSLNSATSFIAEFFPFSKINFSQNSKNLYKFYFTGYSGELFSEINNFSHFFTENILSFLTLVKYFSNSSFVIQSNVFLKTVFIDEQQTAFKFTENVLNDEDLFLNSSSVPYFLLFLQEKYNAFISSSDKKFFLINNKNFNSNKSLINFAEFIQKTLKVINNNSYINNKKILALKFFFSTERKVNDFVKILKERVNIEECKISQILNHQNAELYPLLLNWSNNSTFFNVMLEKIDSSSFNLKDLSLLEKLKDLHLIGYEFLNKVDYTHLM